MQEPDYYPDRYFAFADVLGFSQLVHDFSAGKKKLGHLREMLMRLHNPSHNEADTAAADFRAQSISDGVAVSVATSPIGLKLLFDALEQLSLDFLTQGHFIRGAVVRGKLYHDKHMVFGLAFLDAYHLESEVVKFPRIMVRRNVIEEAKRSSGKMFNRRFRNAEDGPSYIHILRSLEDMMKSDDVRPITSTADRFKTIQAAVQQKFLQAADNPRHFEKVQWFAKYWNSIVPAQGKYDIHRIKGAGAEQPAAV
jgi:hypothetical protein